MLGLGLNRSKISQSTPIINPTGTIFEDNFDGTSLDPAWQSSGTFTTSVSGGLLNVQQATASDFTTYLYRDDYTIFSNHIKASLEYEIKQTDGGDFGVSISFEHPTGRKYHFRYSHIVGDLKVFYQNTNTNSITSGASHIPSLNDTVKIEVTIRDNNGTATVYINGERKFTTNVEWNLNLADATLQPNRMTPSIGFFGCPEVDINYIKLEDMHVKSPIVSFVGDSYTQGYDALLEDNLWRNIVTDYFGLYGSVYAGGGNTTQDILDGIGDIIRNSPSNVVLWIGQNDRATAVPLATIQANIQSIVSQLEAVGIKVHVCTSRPFDIGDALDVWIRGEFTNVIDVNAMLAGGFTMNTTVEGIISGTNHPNEAASRMLAEGVIDYFMEKGF